MKKQFHILIMSLGLLFMPYAICAQLFVDPEGNVGLGLEDSPDARMKILNTSDDEGIGLLIENNSDLANIIGSKITISDLGLGEKIGILGEVDQNASASQLVTGLELSVSTSGSGRAYGIRLSSQGNTTGIRYGISNIVGSNYSNAINPLYGQFNFISVQGSRPTHGLFNIMTTSGNNQDQFGIYNTLSGSGTGLRYGIYSIVNSGEGYAGYFLGDVQINGNLTYTSDENLKENIASLDNALAIISRLEPKAYNFKSTNNYGPNPTQKQYGFLAQQVENVLPEIVKDIAQPAVMQAKEGGTGELEEVEAAVNLKSLDYNALIAILTQGLKEQQVLIDALTKRIEALEK